MQVGLTFNLKQRGTKNTPDPSGTGSSNFQAEFDGVEPIETAGGVFEILRKAQTDILFAIAGGCAGPFFEGSLPSVRDGFSIPNALSGSITQLYSTKALKRYLPCGVAWCR